MTVIVKIITVPFNSEKEVFQDETLSLFLTNKQVRSLQPQFFQNNGRPYWTVFVEYEPILSTAELLPTTETLSNTQQALLRKLKEWRKNKADQSGVPVFILATNIQLTQVATRLPTSLEALRQIQGFGKKKIDQHGREILALVQPFVEKNVVAQSAQFETTLVETTQAETTALEVILEPQP